VDTHQVQSECKPALVYRCDLAAKTRQYHRQVQCQSVYPCKDSRMVYCTVVSRCTSSLQTQAEGPHRLDLHPLESDVLGTRRPGIQIWNPSPIAGEVVRCVVPWHIVMRESFDVDDGVVGACICKQTLYLGMVSRRDFECTLCYVAS
jgi:hypothetical protein